MAEQGPITMTQPKTGSFYPNQISGPNHRSLLTPFNLRRVTSEFVLGTAKRRCASVEDNFCAAGRVAGTYSSSTTPGAPNPRTRIAFNPQAASACALLESRSNSSISASSNLIRAAEVFSSRCLTLEVPGIGSITGDFLSSQAIAI